MIYKYNQFKTENMTIKNKSEIDSWSPSNKLSSVKFPKNFSSAVILSSIIISDVFVNCIFKKKLG